MTFPTVLPVSEFRAQATKLIKHVVAHPGRRVYVGANRRPEAVLMEISEDVPFSIRSTLLETYFTHLAEHGPKTWSEDGKLLHIGDDFGRVFAWLWRSDQDEALDHLSDYIWRLRYAKSAPAVQSLEDVLAAMRFAADITDDEYRVICERARDDLADRFAADPGPDPIE